MRATDDRAQLPSSPAQDDPDPPDALLVHGPPDGFTVLFDRHAPAVHRYLSRRVGPLADDLLAETFLVAFRRRVDFEPRRVDVLPWLLGIATNLLRRHARDERRRYRALARLHGREPRAHPTDDVEQRLDAQALKGPLAAALAALAAPDRDVLLLVAWQQLTYAEVAEVLGIPVGTVRSRLHRARRITRGALAMPLLDLSPEETP